MNQNLAWVLLFLPLLTAIINWLFLSKRPTMTALTSTLSCLVTLVISCGLIGATGSASFQWLAIPSYFSIDIGYLLDPLSVNMMVVVTGIGFLVNVFSFGYMKDDDARSRYFTGLSLFMFSMTTIVLATNLAMTFIGWELVGLSSYLLIGHFYKKDAAVEASKKAFITNRIGDFGFLAGILIMWAVTGSLSFFNMKFPDGTSEGMMTLAILCLFCGAIGKSAQFPLHVWLPDAMEGPTPVSALIHAATMVAAGVYMMVRLQVTLTESAFTPVACNVIMAIGAITAVIAALMATQQNDIKRILAYSTLSQLGYMIMAVGLFAGEAAMFHLYTHAWFKALLFLGAGAIIYACHHEQDIWKMGGLIRKMKVTTLTFLVGSAALIAVPGLSGFFSKESILAAAMERNQPFYFWIGAGVALLTTFYMVRLILVVFSGKARSEQAEHAHEVGGSMLVPLIVLAAMSLVSGYGFLANNLVPANDFKAPGFHIDMVFFVSLGALVIGLIFGVIFYSGSPTRDKLSGNPVSRLFANRFYIDEFYNKVLIRGIQGTFSAILDFLDQFVITSLCVGGSARLVAGVGCLLRKLQAGYIGLYSLLIGVGVLLVVYFMVY